MVCIALLYIFLIIVLQYNYIACLRYYFDEHLSDSEYIVESVSQLDIIFIAVYCLLHYYNIYANYYLLAYCIYDYIALLYYNQSLLILSITGREPYNLT